MRRRPADRRPWGLGVALLSAPVGCNSEPCVDDDDLWETPPSGRICVLGDLVVEGREPEELGVLARVEEIEGSLLIHRNLGVTELPAWTGLERIGGSLAISDNAALVAVGGFLALEELGGGVYVAENPELVRFELGDAVSTVDSLFIGLNSQLVQIAGLNGLTQVRGDVNFIENAALAALGMSGLVEVGGDFFVSDNPNLREAEFPFLQLVAGSWRIADNAALESLAGFAMLTEVGEANVVNNDAVIEWMLPDAFVTERLEIGYNTHMTTIVGPAGVARMGAVDVRSNPELVDVAGFDEVEVLADLRIEGNGDLRELSGFRALTRIDNALTIVWDPALVASTGLMPVLESAQTVSIYTNPSLEPALVDELLSHMTIAGVIRVGDNKGQDTALDPCPWPEDGICDSDWGVEGAGTGLCAADLEDCSA